MAFEALTGGLPFGGGTLVEIAQRRTELDPPRASERLPELPAAVDAVLQRGLAREPAERWQDGDGVRRCARGALAGRAGPRRRRSRAASTARRRSTGAG